jgi:nucleotide-binding universal stress UspA family protein
MDHGTYLNDWRSPRVYRRSPSAQPAPATGPEPPAGPTWAPTVSTHLVLLNGAEERPGGLLGVAGHLAQRARAAVRVAFLQPPPTWGDVDSIRLLTPAADRRPVAEISDRLLWASRDLTIRSGVRAGAEMLIGPAEPTLSEYVAADQYDLVTVAAGGTWPPLWAGGLWSVVAGWRPVLVVGRKVSPLWSTGPVPPGEVLAVLDGTAAAEDILAPAAALCRLLDGRLTLLRVTGTGQEDSVAECHRYLTGVAQRVRSEVPAVRTVVSSGHPTDAVLRIQKATGAIVALAAPARRWLAAFTPRRTVIRLLRESTAPVLIHRPAQ